VRNVLDLDAVLKKAQSGEPIMFLVRKEREGEYQDYIVTLRMP
jgi:hypothetical protein